MTKNEQAKETVHNKTFKGEVVSAVMKDTIVVIIENYKKHSKYKKYLTHRKRYKVHDQGNTSKVGDIVIIEETRPISKDKHFKLSRIVSTKTV
ncbi:MAG: 30S ribosomal protein S17 [Patescibacteria group bacterium]